MPFPWYASVEGAGLEQGDILRNCRAPLPPRLPGEPEPAQPIENEEFVRAIVLTQSCDLADPSTRRVMLAPVYELDEFLDAIGGGRNDKREKLKRGHFVAYHLLNLCSIDGHHTPHTVVDFGDAFSVPIEYARGLTAGAARLRLLAPYREHLAQGFARYYMRVGLPIPIDPFP